ncbi:MAG: PKD domain-containing protein [Patescibacteria group bacterium]
MKALSRFLVSVAAVASSLAFAAAAFDNDLSLVASELVIQPVSGVVAGRVVKIYTTVHNNGSQDLIGTVKFFVDGAQIATDQPVSVKSGSIPDEVFVNWTAIVGQHKIAAKIFPSEPAGDDPSNDYVEKTFFVDADSDRDGVGDSVDIDDDNDGLNDEAENSGGTNPKKYDTDGDGVNDAKDVFPLDPTEWEDTDKDGIGNNADPDDDNDRLPDSAEAQLGTDPLNPDTDGDGVEKCSDLLDKFPLDKNECFDSDGDGVGDNSDQFPNDPSESGDCDKDGIGNNADPDDDNDGVLDAKDALPCDAGETLDCDKDGIGNNQDQDDDNDGVEDSKDAFPCDPNESKDSDQDGLGDNADPNDANQGPIVFFEGNQIVVVGETATFDGSRSTDQDGELTAFEWDFGDGSPTSKSAKATHIYQKVGQYLVKLKVTDNSGESRVKSALVVVENSPLLEQILLWLMILLLLIFLYIFWRTVQHKKKPRR